MDIKEEIHALSEEMLTNLGRLVAIDSQLGTCLLYTSTEYNFNMLSEKYQGEQRELNAKIERLHEAMEAAAQTAVDAEKWIGLMKQYVNPTESVSYTHLDVYKRQALNMKIPFLQLEIIPYLPAFAESTFHQIYLAIYHHL